MVIRTKTIAAVVGSLLSCSGLVNGQNLSSAQIDIVITNLASIAKQPWELGTRAQALIEHGAPQYSVFSSSPVPPPSSVPSNATSALAPVFSLVNDVVSGRAKSNGGVSGPQPLIKDAAAADPASLGVAVLLANWTGQDKGKVDYAGAAKDQLDYLMQKVPRTPDGAISHREQYVQLWSDFVYMVPPFLSYYGVLTQNQSLVNEGYNQISLYRKYLRDGKAGNMWKHVLLGPSQNDEGHWSTGNGWAAAGMLRVLSTIQRSQYANAMKKQQIDLANWVREIQDGIYPHLDKTSIFANYADQAVSGGNFYDAASTALLASTVYRIALQWGVHAHLPQAEKSRIAISSSKAASSRRKRGESAVPSSSSSASKSSSHPHASSSSRPTSTPAVLAPASSIAASSKPASSKPASSTAPAPSPTPTSFANMQHFSGDGFLTPVVDPSSYGSEGTQSPEGQAFVVEMQAAWADWVAAGSPGANGAAALLAGRWRFICVSAVVGMLML